MPTLARFPQSKITMYAGDHLPPHFHVLMNDGREALVEISTLAVMRGSVPARELTDALTWAAANGVYLSQQWKVLNP